MKINQNLVLEKFKKDYYENKIVQIENFLEEQSAQKIFSFLNSDMQEDWWSRSVHINTKDYPKVINTRRFESNIQQINLLTDLANESLSNDIFSYSFDRTSGKHFNTCKCEFCRFDEFLNSEELLTTICMITNEQITKATETFAARYTEGCFLSPHHDKSKGKIGFVLNLAKNWRPEYGGNLNITDESGFNVIKTITPKFNNLVIFDIPNYNGIPHFVSHVSPGIKKKRISVTGWFQ
jgi:SM-20-related protein